MEVNIKTKLLYFYEDEWNEFKDLVCKAIRKYWGEKAEEEGNLPDLLIRLMVQNGTNPIETNKSYEGKHNKTTLLYFNEPIHKSYTKYINKYVFKNMEEGGCKKQAQTQAIMYLLRNYLS